MTSCVTSLIKNRSELSTSHRQINVHRKRSLRSNIAFHVDSLEASGGEDSLAKSQCRLGTWPGWGRQLALVVQTDVLVVTRRSDNKRTNKGVAGERPTGSKKSRRPSGRPPLLSRAATSNRAASSRTNVGAVSVGQSEVLPIFRLGLFISFFFPPSVVLCRCYGWPLVSSATAIHRFTLPWTAADATSHLSQSSPIQSCTSVT